MDMSKTTDNNATIGEQTDKDAEKLREASDLIDEVAHHNGGAIDAFLRDLERGVEETAVILDEENGDVTVEELQKRVFPRGGPR